MKTLEDVLEQINQTLSEKPYDEVNKKETWQIVLALFPDEVIEIYENHNDISNKHKILNELFKIIDYLIADLEDINYALAFHFLTKLKPLGNNSNEISDRINRKLYSIKNQDNKPLFVKYPWIIGVSIIALIIIIIIITT